MEVVRETTVTKSCIKCKSTLKFKASEVKLVSDSYLRSVVGEVYCPVCGSRITVYDDNFK